MWLADSWHIFLLCFFFSMSFSFILFDILWLRCGFYALYCQLVSFNSVKLRLVFFANTISFFSFLSCVHATHIRLVRQPVGLSISCPSLNLFCLTWKHPGLTLCSYEIVFFSLFFAVILLFDFLFVVWFL